MVRAATPRALAAEIACYILPVLTDCYLPSSWRAKPRSFVALMGLYESSYQRLRLLVGDPAELAGQRQAVVPGECELHLLVIDQAPYTCEFELSFRLPEVSPNAWRWEYLPRLRVCAYHDARLAAAQPERQADSRELAERWRCNIFLNRLLEFCLERGFRLERRYA